MKDFIGKNLTLAVIVLVLAALACNLPAQTSKADATPTSTTVTDATGAATQSPSSPASPSGPTVTVSSVTNCRTGPGTNYDLVLTFQPGATAEVVGKYTPTNYWIIKTPTGGTCWLWGAYATVQGDTSSLAEIQPPSSSTQVVAQNPTNTPKSPKAPKPTATATKSLVYVNPGLVNPILVKAALAPSAPSSLSVSTSCTYNIFPHTLQVRTDHLSWSAVGNATGYYVYENGSKISGTSGTSINLIGATSAGSVSFGVVAYNSFGTSSTTSKSSACP